MPERWKSISSPNQLLMKRIRILTIVLLMTGVLAFVAAILIQPKDLNASGLEPIAGCTFQTLFGEEKFDTAFHYKTPENVEASIKEGLDWIRKAQQANGGWGAGSHSAQHIRDPHAVSTDPATTAMVAMAIMRTGTDFEAGPYKKELRDATIYLLEAVESAGHAEARITNVSGTQIQSKLGQYIDEVMTVQFLSNVVGKLDNDPALKGRVQIALNIAVDKVQSQQMSDGRTRGAGWAGVLQSGLAQSALESAEFYGAEVDMEKFEKAKEYQRDNFDVESGSVETSAGAGVVLYAVSNSTRAAAKDARKARNAKKKAVEEGLMDEDDELEEEVLQELGFDVEEAEQLVEASVVYEKANAQATSKAVMGGYGSDGGEEFLSFLQTGESMIVNGDDKWKGWYDNVSGHLLRIQNSDGSWNGHHCITSPVFCTATCLLILSVDNDLEELVAMGAE
jgi:hypothetical protein